MPTPPLRKAQSTSLRRARSTQRTGEPSASARSGLKPTEPCHAANTPDPADDFAFTLDPLSGSVTLHVGRDGTRHVLDARAAEETAVASRLGISATAEAARGDVPTVTPQKWSDLEPRPIAAPSERAAIIAPVPNPDAVH
jgi:hypothetical protein